MYIQYIINKIILNIRRLHYIIDIHVIDIYYLLDCKKYNKK